MTAPTEELIEQSRSRAVGLYGIEIEDLSVRYGETRAVHHLSMHVPHGSIYGLVGPSGSGKSTTMRVLATLHQPDAGIVLIDGIDVQEDPAAARGRIGYLPDFSGLYEGLTVSEYLDFFGAMYGIPPRRRRSTAEELLELSGLVDRRNAPVKSLSRGMKQKLGLARCLIHDPSVLLLDEPAAGMDAASRLELRDILQELARMHKTILISSHLLAELSATCTYLGIMRAGTLLAEGSVHEIMQAVAPDSLLRIELLGADDAAVAQQLLQSYPACRDVAATGAATLTMRCAGDRQELAAILTLLSERGVHVTEFALDRPTLEEVFLRVIDRGEET